MTQLQAARAGRITPEMRRVAERENVTAAFIRDHVAAERAQNLHADKRDHRTLCGGRKENG